MSDHEWDWETLLGAGDCFTWGQQLGLSVAGDEPVDDFGWWRAKAGGN